VAQYVNGSFKMADLTLTHTPSHHRPAPWITRTAHLCRTTRVSKPILFPILFHSLTFALAFEVVLFWALVVHAEHIHTTELCASTDRLLDRGFVGNPEFYGLGIRLGIYFQWVGSLLANAFLPSERRAMGGAYAAFTAALLIATLVLVFQHACAFSVEIIILLTILWGGSFLVLVPLYTDPSQRKIRGLDLIFSRIVFLLVPVTAWFWWRMALMGQVDFTPTPGGTTFFLLAKVHENGLKAASCFMAFVVIWIVCSPILDLLPELMLKVRIRWVRSAVPYVAYLPPSRFISTLFNDIFGVMLFLGNQLWNLVTWQQSQKDSLAIWIYRARTDEKTLQWYVHSLFYTILTYKVNGHSGLHHYDLVYPRSRTDTVLEQGD
jgi:hypothetical protein